MLIVWRREEKDDDRVEKRRMLIVWGRGVKRREG